MNFLSNETSPYLKMHANNPVQWYPWSNDALEKAQDEDKPILLSIGYSACHWCHVMAEESFADPKTAELMNRYFINIKVDREERPDLDHLYQYAHQVLNMQPGGWPLTLFLNPIDLAPFFGGTYFPKEARHGLPAFSDVLEKVNTYFHEHRDQVQRYTQQLKYAIENPLPHHTQAHALSEGKKWIDAACLELATHFDPHEGGFSKAPKFPMAPQLAFILSHWGYSKLLGAEDISARKIISFTLEKMEKGGIHDHLDGGFFRYAVDNTWTIPHFEKMLYDNALLLGLYSEAGASFHQAVFKKTALGIADFALSQCAATYHGFFTSINADSEGKEGLFYLWSLEEIKNLLDEDLFSVFSFYFGLTTKPNFENQFHLHQLTELSSIAHHLDLDEKTVLEKIALAKPLLRAAREKREHPSIDTKILTSQNALMIKALAQAAFALNDARLLQKAHQTLQFIYSNAWSVTSHQLYSCWIDSHAKTNAFLDDYAFLIDAILHTIAIEWNTELFHFCQQLAVILLEHFFDTENGGFYFTDDKANDLLTRPKIFQDSAIPSGYAVAVQTLFDLSFLCKNAHFYSCAEVSLQAALPFIETSPSAHASLLIAMQSYLMPRPTIVVRGSKVHLGDWRAVLREHYLPIYRFYFIPEDIQDLPEGLQAYSAIPGKTVAYICEGVTCLEPIECIEDFSHYLRDRTR